MCVLRGRKPLFQIAFTLIIRGAARMSHIKFLVSIGLIMGLGLGLSACAPEDYGVCTIPNTSKHKAACNSTDGTAATCVVEYVFDCDSLLCGKHNGDGPYCTERCVPSAEKCAADGNTDCSCPEGKNCTETCPENGSCEEWTKGTSAYYCVRPAE